MKDLKNKMNTINITNTQQVLDEIKRQCEDLNFKIDGEYGYHTELSAEFCFGVYANDDWIYITGDGTILIDVFQEPDSYECPGDYSCNVTSVSIGSFKATDEETEEEVAIDLTEKQICDALKDLHTLI